MQSKFQGIDLLGAVLKLEWLRRICDLLGGKIDGKSLKSTARLA